VRAAAEREVLAGARTVEAERVGLVVHRPVAVRRREAERGLRPCGDRGAVDGRAVRAVTHQHVDRRVVAQRLLDRGRDQVALGAQAREQRGIGAHGLEHVADEVPGGLVAGHEEERELGSHLEVGEALAVDLGVQQPRDEVVGRIGCSAALGDHAVEVGGELRRHPGEPFAVDAILSLVLRGVGALHDDVGPLGEARVVGRIGAEQVRDHRRRDRRHVLGDQVAATPREQAVEQLVAQVAGERLHPADAVLRDRRVDDAADLPVARLGDLADQLLLGRHHHTRFAEARLERVEVLRRREHVLVAGEVPRTRRGLRHRALGTQAREVLVRDAGRDVERIGGGHAVCMVARLRSVCFAAVGRG
jgi:hypothetical protein